jgi:hypothetical protein
VQSIAAAEALRAALGITLPAIYCPAHQRLLTQARAALGDDVVQSVLATGQSLSQEEAITSVPWLAPTGTSSEEKPHPETGRTINAPEASPSPA